jgi:DNA-binding CsgD family transcriptional regulator
MVGAAAELDRVAEVCARLNLVAGESDLAGELLEPIANLVGAETASLRCFGLAHGAPAPLSIVSIAIPASVKDAYLSRYFALDPIRGLLERRLDRPLFADPLHSGEWSDETTAATTRDGYRGDFLRYRREFLLPNHFCHHLGFCVQDSAGKVLALDFHRAQRSRDFAPIEHARARVVAACLYAKAAGERALPAAELALSARETQVAEAVANGCSNKQVADELGISVRTVENHLRSIFAKCGVTTRTRLAAKLRGSQRASRD